MGEQLWNGKTRDEGYWGKKYEFVKQSIEKATNGEVDVFWPNDDPNPGHKEGSTREHIFRNLMLADIVIADVSCPNANVFFELGLRYASRDKLTLLIWDQAHKDHLPPFDIIDLKRVKFDYAEY